VIEEPVAESAGDITDNEFEQLLDSLNAVKAEAEAPLLLQRRRPCGRQ
jgi:two-component system chemotaxis sensor kinase CheA